MPAATVGARVLAQPAPLTLCKCGADGIRLVAVPNLSRARPGAVIVACNFDSDERAEHAQEEPEEHGRVRINIILYSEKQNTSPQCANEVLYRGLSPYRMSGALVN